MFGILCNVVRALWSANSDTRSLTLSNLALRHRPGVLERKGAMPTSMDTDRPNAPGLALADMVQMEGSAPYRATRDRDRVASPGMAAVLDVEKSAVRPRASDGLPRHPKAHP